MNQTQKKGYEQCMAVDSSAIVFEITESETTFYLSMSETKTMPVGYELVSSRFFRHTPPNADDIEYGINYIEDEIAKVVHSIPSQERSLITSTSYVKNLAKLCAIPERNVMDLSTRQLENLFSQYAEIVIGRPPRSDEPDTSARFFAQLLILREFMHHFKVEGIRVVK
ncbi:hypothetical protein [Vibrio viridaestus]|uniref:Uncharacterized protein n=1 Tax=Vibrio viridaestus TaxID=2487322 RepID=A0A3N9TF94_9VIBR|nr:hypothetical protein [Vibrio viridaestus]RQW62544.1 hypothetical protein EES38_12520 [Vibrio viridaestus]